MQLARVVGHVVAPVKHQLFHGHKLLLVRPEDPHGRPSAPAVLAVDRVDAGIGDRVLLLHEGSSARDLVGEPYAPIRAVIVGFVDGVDVKDDTEEGVASS